MAESSLIVHGGVIVEEGFVTMVDGGGSFWMMVVGCSDDG